MIKNYPRSFSYLYVILFLITSYRSFAQLPPVINPITGPYAACANVAKSYSTSASNSPTSYSWSVHGPSGTNAMISSPTTATTNIYFPFSYTQQNTYTVYVYAQNNGGTSVIKSLIVNVYETPFVTFSGSQFICQGSSTNLSASPTNGSASSTLSYSWMPSTGLNTTTGPHVIAAPFTSINYTVLVSNGTCSSTANTFVFVSNCITGITKIQNSTSESLFVYPNPNNGTFFIKSDKNELAIILNEIGQTVRSLNLEAGTETTISGLPGGIYFVVSATVRKKIVITN